MNNRKLWPRILVIIFWFLFITPVFVSVILFSRIANGKMGFMPTFEDLENPNNNIASEIYSEDTVLLGKLFYENRSYVDFHELSPNMVNSLLAIEDIRFYDHSGIDFKALIRVFWGLASGNRKGGGSTLTQQLAKNLFGRDTVTYDSKLESSYQLAITKFKEWITAVRLERNYTKNEILVMYLNTVPFGSNSFGIKTAARTFFNLTPDSLSINEAALLAGVVNAPTRYSPVRNPESSFQRRNLVLSQMLKYDYIKPEEYDSLIAEPIALKMNSQDHDVGLATYFRSFVRDYINAKPPVKGRYDYLEDSLKWIEDPLYGWCYKNKKPNGKPYDLFGDGLRIYTTLNSKMQKYAEQSVEEHLSEKLQKEFWTEKKGRRWGPYDLELEKEEYEYVINLAIRRTERFRKMKWAGISEDSILASFERPVKMRIFSWDGEKDTIMTPFDSIMYYKSLLRSGFMAMDPKKGHVKAYVGGINFKHFQYDHVSQGKNQAGSTFKPFLYILAMEEGYSPCYKVRNVAQTFYVLDTVWQPRSAGKKEDYGRLVTLKWGLATSENNISAWLLKKFNPESIVKVAHDMGIKSKIDAVPSMIYGTSDVSVWEMVSAYSSFANKGVHIEPIFVTRIEDKHGNKLFESSKKITEAISEQTAYLMLNLMQGVVDGGTASSLRYRYGLEGEIAGKTGTTNNHSDGWFMGVTQNLVGGCWVGGEDRPIRFDNIVQGQGAHMALPIWALFMQKVYADSSLKIHPVPFDSPVNINMNLNCRFYDEKENVDSPDNYIERDSW